jgi:hypothetical protein
MHYNRQPIAQCIIDDPWSHLCLNVENESIVQSLISLVQPFSISTRFPS